MRSASTISSSAKTRFNGLTGRRWAVRAPSGAVSTLPSHDLPKSRRQVRRNRDSRRAAPPAPSSRPARSRRAPADGDRKSRSPRGGGDRPRCKRDVVPSMKGTDRVAAADAAPSSIPRQSRATRQRRVPALPRQPRCGARLEVQPHAGWRHRTRKAVKNTLQQHRRHLPPQHRTGTRPSTMPGASMRTAGGQTTAPWRDWCRRTAQL